MYKRELYYPERAIANQFLDQHGESRIYELLRDMRASKTEFKERVTLIKDFLNQWYPKTSSIVATGLASWTMDGVIQ